MMRQRRGVRLGMALLLLPAGGVLALEPRVKDDAGFFKPETIREADQRITQTKEQLGRDFVVETFPDIPSSIRGKYQRMDHAQFYRQWASERAKHIGVNGAYLLIVRNPPHLQIAWSGEQHALTNQQAGDLNQLLLNGFRQKQYDPTLLAAISFFRSHAQARASGMQAERPPDSPGAGTTGSVSPPPPPSRYNPPPPARFESRGWGLEGWICLGAAVLIVFLLIRGLSRTFSGSYGRSDHGPPGGPPGGLGGGYGGGGFGRGLLGGLLGGMVGGWAADRFTESRREDDARTSPTSSDADSDFGSIGGDLGSAGGDFGGGSDSGGGGDFSSTGGDFG
jgi:hypothetical protein